MKSPELDGNAGTYADEGCQSAFVEGKGSFVDMDRASCGEGVGAGCGGLEPDLYNVEGLTWGSLA